MGTEIPTPRKLNSFKGNNRLADHLRFFGPTDKNCRRARKKFAKFLD